MSTDDMIPRQPTTGGPYHAVVRGPDGLDINVSGPAELVALQLRAVADAISPKRPTVNYRDAGRR